MAFTLLPVQWSLVNGLDAPSWGSEVEFHSQCGAGSHQAREPESKRNRHDEMLCRHAELGAVGQSSTCCRCYERGDALLEAYRGPGHLVKREAHA